MTPQVPATHACARYTHILFFTRPRCRCAVAPFFFFSPASAKTPLFSACPPRRRTRGLTAGTFHAKSMGSSAMEEPSEAFRLTATGPVAEALVKYFHMAPDVLPLKYTLTVAFSRCRARTETLADFRSAA